MSQYIKKIRTESGDLQIDYNSLANLPQLSTMFSNPNLLINGDFRHPVNQRGQTSYTNSKNWVWCYGIDRWACDGKLNTCNLTVNNGSITITNTGSEAAHLRQTFERAYDNGVYTATISVIAVTGTVNVYVDAASKSEALRVGKNVISLTGAPTYFNFLLAAGSSIQLEYVKLEPGNVSTMFVPRLFAEEIAICKRYFNVISGIRVMGGEQSNELKSYCFSIPAEIKSMMTSPTISTSGVTNTNSTSGICVRSTSTAVLTGFNFTYDFRNSELLVTATSSSTLSKNGHEVQLYINNDFKIWIDAEIY